MSSLTRRTNPQGSAKSNGFSSGSRLAAYALAANHQPLPVANTASPGPKTNPGLPRGQPAPGRGATRGGQKCKTPKALFTPGPSPPRTRTYLEANPPRVEGQPGPTSRSTRGGWLRKRKPQRTQRAQRKAHKAAQGEKKKAPLKVLQWPAPQVTRPGPKTN